MPPRECTPQVVRGGIASGDQVVDDPSNDFFAQVLKAWPRINAVEMEGAGAAAAIEQAGSPGDYHKIHDDLGNNDKSGPSNQVLMSFAWKRPLES